MTSSGKRVLACVLAMLILALGALVGWRVWQEQQRQKTLATAEMLYDAGDYAAAREAFLTLGYEARVADCDAQLRLLEMEARYAAAEALLASGAYLDAKEAFLTLEDYEDAPQRALECDFRRRAMPPRIGRQRRSPCWRLLALIPVQRN